MSPKTITIDELVKIADDFEEKYGHTPKEARMNINTVAMLTKGIRVHSVTDNLVLFDSIPVFIDRRLKNGDVRFR